MKRRKRTVTRLTGTIVWDGDPGKIVTAIIREGGKPEPHEHDIAIRCTYENERTYEVGLDRVGGELYRGSYSATLGKERWRGGVQCSVLRSGDTFRLVGKWSERGEM